MRNMSFSMTEQALVSGAKTVTRRLGWKNLKPGDRVCAIRKGMGLRPGEKVVRLAEIEITDVRREPLVAITSDDVKKEGYPDMSANEFIAAFERAIGCDEKDDVTRIEFRVVKML